MNAVVTVVGATATGKSALAIAIASALDGEIVNADASQLYRGMDIGTAKVPPAERDGIAHHQLDVLDIHDDASVAAYQTHARTDIDAILARGHLPVICGGSGLYVRAAIDVLEIPPTDPTVRAAWQARLDTVGIDNLYAELTRRDPVAAHAIEPRNARRIVRALEVIDLTGRPFSATMPRREYLRPTVQIGLRLPRPDLDARIERRTAQMWHHGLLDEVTDLQARGLAETRTASRAVGYAQALAQLDGRCTEADAITDTTRATRRLVRRQESWFGADPRIHWLDADRDDLLDAARHLIDNPSPTTVTTPVHPTKAE
ncbi:tRNA dimethylallyltransferase [Austwickia sp. TVS 96-490-7B]|uniref:tRNA (adenosine(37)-N6)-dimethylallyltransferase MiaA n=1 Tax=Austwickia sp. TVS 96-490-7B TaxID=2830843 RepID=UPI001C598A7D|nr:tRNA (adenosine(37)-N6)-dimethylallyltransferase MiaA [Austwickia sp. TVS 96-490-7B]MBW3086474.1 tRNA dimethylallyltransferase [Austwickia sp. TVS 96-490-7B]